jgi:hypothetical protein
MFLNISCLNKHPPYFKWHLVTLFVIPTRALHSKLLSKILSRVLCRNEFSQVETSSVKAQKTCSDPNFQKTPISETLENENCEKNTFCDIFHNFLQELGSEPVGTSRNEFSRVTTSSVKARKTHSDPNFW